MHACTAVLLMTGSLQGIQMNIQMNYKQAIVPLFDTAGRRGRGRRLRDDFDVLIAAELVLLRGYYTLLSIDSVRPAGRGDRGGAKVLWMRSHRISEQTRTHERARMHAYAMHTRFH